jgi:hypothetical protein
MVFRDDERLGDEVFATLKIHITATHVTDGVTIAERSVTCSRKLGRTPILSNSFGVIVGLAWEVPIRL